MKNQKGFTLIEIVMVLVLLGILGAVAVPKYFDMQENAEAKAAQAIGAEYQARINGAFAQALLDGKACGTATTGARAVAINELPTSEELQNEKYSLTYTAPAENADKVVLTIKFKNGVTAAGHSYTALIPVCK